MVFTPGTNAMQPIPDSEQWRCYHLLIRHGRLFQLPTGDTYSLDYTTNPDDVYLDINGPTSVGSPAPKKAPFSFPLS